MGTLVTCGDTLKRCFLRPVKAAVGAMRVYRAL